MPKMCFFTKGVGRHKNKLTSFEFALRDAKIEKFNLVTVSSIFPPHCKLVTREAGLKFLKPGQILFVVLSENATDDARRVISASIGMAIPDDPSRYGYLAEHDSTGESEKEAGCFTEYLAAEMLATKLGAKLAGPPAKGRKTFDISNGVSLKTRSICQSAVGAKGVWTTALAAAVLVA